MKGGRKCRQRVRSAAVPLIHPCVGAGASSLLLPSPLLFPQTTRRGFQPWQNMKGMGDISRNTSQELLKSGFAIG